MAKSTKVTIKQTLEANLDRIQAVLPKGMDAERMLRLATFEVAKNPKLLSADPQSVLMAVVDACRIGLELGREAHLVPYGSKVQMIPDFKGMIALAYRSGHVKSVYASVVYTKDTFRVQEGTDPLIFHAPDLMSNERGIDDIVCFYATAKVQGENVFAIMTKPEVDAIRRRSKASSSGPWVTDFVEMGKKTCFKRLTKILPSSAELQEAVELDHKVEMGELPSVDMEQLAREATKERVAALRDEVEAVAGSGLDTDPIE